MAAINIWPGGGTTVTASATVNGVDGGSTVGNLIQAGYRQGTEGVDECPVGELFWRTDTGDSNDDFFATWNESMPKDVPTAVLEYAPSGSYSIEGNDENESNQLTDQTSHNAGTVTPSLAPGITEVGREWAATGGQDVGFPWMWLMIGGLMGRANFVLQEQRRGSFQAQAQFQGYSLSYIIDWEQGRGLNGCHPSTNRPKG